MQILNLYAVVLTVIVAALLAIVPALIVSVIALVVVSLATPKPSPEQIAAFYEQLTEPAIARLENCWA